MSVVERRVLLLAPRGRDAQVIAQVLSPNDFACVVCESISALAGELQNGADVAFVTEEALLDWPYAELVDWLAGQPPWSDFPFIVLATRRTGSRSAAARETLEALGNVVILERPLNAETLLSAANSAVRARQRQYQTRRHLHQEAQAAVETRRLLEAEMDARQQMHAAREMLALALEAAELGIFHWALSSGVIRWNKTARAQFFIGPEDPVSLDRFFEILHPDDRARVQRSIDSALDGSQAFDVEYRAVAATGQTRWIRAKGRAYRDAEGAPSRFDGVTIDISRQKVLEREREVLLQAERGARIHAEDASRMKDEFLANLSHELRTPLGAILGWTHVLGKAKLPPDQQRAVETIARNARAQAKLIEDLLDMSRIISGNIRLELEPVLVANTIDAVVASLQPVAATRSVQVLAESDRSVAAVCGDPHRLQQIIWNLLSNAIKFSPEGGEVSVALSRAGDRCELSVADQGVGIAAEFLPFVFDRFRQADASSTRGHGGLGLGLAIVKTLVDLHGGQVEAASPGLGRGATFTVSLPLLSSKSNTGEAVVEPVPVVTRRYGVDLSGLRVLVVDDEPDLRDLVREVLVECGAEVLAVASGAEALSRIEPLRPHLLISDIAMPQMDGYELLRRVRLLGDEFCGRLPAIALTAFAHAEDRTRALLAGFRVHVPKPVEASELIATVAALAGRT